jgi:hypothetical protein
LWRRDDADSKSNRSGRPRVANLDAKSSSGRSSSITISLAENFRRKDSNRKERRISEEIKEETELEYGDGYRDDDSD